MLVEHPAHDAQRMRRAGPELLSLALMDARNQVLRWMAVFETTGAPATPFGFSDFESARAELAQSLDALLDELSSVGNDDAALQRFRCALHEEDKLLETLYEEAQALDLDAAAQAPMWPDPVSRVQREPLWFAAQTWLLGTPDEGGFVPANEQWAHEVAVPEFEIDAQAVNWSQFVEFVEDGGYDDARLWSEPGQAWLQAEGRRAPRYVEQLGQGVIVRRHGRLQRAAAAQAVTHVSAFEAEAWCRWAGRRLPTEAEWELAACTAASRGFVWGDAWEWMLGSARPYPGGETVVAGQRVLRGGSWVTPPRLRHPKARRFVDVSEDGAFCGFRSCAL